MQVPFLADTGADQTAFSENILKGLSLQPIAPPYHLGGVGGIASSVLVNTQIRLFRDDGIEVYFRGQFSAFTDPAALDMSVLGRDLINLFALIVDRPRNFIALLGQRHQYTIVQQ